MRAPNGVHTDFRQANVPHIASLDHVRHGANRVFNRHAGVKPGHAVDVDVIGVEPLQGISQKILDRCGPAVSARPAASRVAQRTKLNRQQRVVTSALQRFANQRFVMALAIKVAGVQQVDACIQRRVQRGHALCIITCTIHA